MTTIINYKAEIITVFVGLNAKIKYEMNRRAKARIDHKKGVIIIDRESFFGNYYHQALMKYKTWFCYPFNRINYGIHERYTQITIEQIGKLKGKMTLEERKKFDKKTKPFSFPVIIEVEPIKLMLNSHEQE